MAAATPSPHEIRSFRSANPTLRERDLAAQLDISEAALVAAECGLTATRIDGNANTFLSRAAELGSVLALTRNESAVHEKDGVYDNVTPGKFATLVLGGAIDLRVFPSAWAHGFAVTKTDGDTVRRSFQFFDCEGMAVHKVHLRAHSNVDAFVRITDDLALEDQSQTFVPTARPVKIEEISETDVAALRDNWSRMTDTHEFFGMLKKLKVNRQEAVRRVGEDYAWQLDNQAAEAMLNASAAGGLPIMCFVGNPGMIQIHSGPVQTIKAMGPWLNVMDDDFHLHLRMDHIAETWAVRKPTKDGHVTSVEIYDAKGEMIIQFFGKRHEGNREQDAWRGIVENLNRFNSTVAA